MGNAAAPWPPPTHPPTQHPQVTVPTEFQGAVIGDINRRKGIIMGSEQEGDDVVVQVRACMGSLVGLTAHVCLMASPHTPLPPAPTSPGARAVE